MSASVESRIVTMKFDNAAFNKGVSTTMSVLDGLKKALTFPAGSGAFDKMQGAADKFSLGTMETGIGEVSNKFLALSTVAITALANITNRAVDAGLTLAKALTIDPIKQGLDEYEIQLNAVQTVLSNTQASGATLQDVNDTFAELNEYADLTIYNFAEMTKNIGTFTAAGVDLDTAAASIKGIANLAAISGSNSQQASTAMYQLSQAISAGKVGLQDWNSVVNAGMGGTVFQRALAETAVNMGEISESALTLEGDMKNVKIEGQSFRESIMAGPGQQSWLTSDVLTSTLKQLTGDMTEAELAAEGYSKAQIKAIRDQAAAAVSAASDVKTLTQLIDVAKESVASGWAQTWMLIFGDFEQAKRSFSRASNAIGTLIQGFSDARNEMLKTWQEEGGRKALIRTITRAWLALGSVLGPVRDAFREVFPPLTGKILADITRSIRAVVASLILSEEASEGLRQIFVALFTVLDIGLAVVGGVVRYFFDLVLIFGRLVGPIFELIGAIADLVFGISGVGNAADTISGVFDFLIAARREILVPIVDTIGLIISAFASLINNGPAAFFKKLDGIPGLLSDFAGAIKNSFGNALGFLGNIFDPILDALGPVGDLIREMASTVGTVFSGMAGVVKAFAVEAFGPLIDVISNLWGNARADGLVGGFESARSRLEPIIEWFRTTFAGTLEAIFDKITPMAEAAGRGVSNAFSLIGDAFGYVVSALAPIAAKITGLFGDVNEGVSESTNALGSSASVMDKLRVVFAAVGDGFVAAYESIKGFLSGFKGGVAAGLSGIGSAIAAGFSAMFGSLTAGLSAIGADGGKVGEAIGSFFGFIKERIGGFIENTSFQEAVALINAGFFILLYKSIKKFIDSIRPLFEEVTGVFENVSGVIEEAGGTLKAMQKDIIAGALLKIAFAILILAAALFVLSKIPGKQLAIGLGAVGAMLAALTLSMKELSKTADSFAEAGNMAVVATAMLILGVALLALAKAVSMFGKMDPETLAQGMLAIGIAIGGLVKTMNTITGLGRTMLAASISVGILAFALVAFAGAIKLFSMIDPMTIVRGLVAIVATLVAIRVGMSQMPKSMIATATGLVILSVALLAMSKALKNMGSLSGEEVAKSLIALGGAMLILSLSIRAMDGMKQGAVVMAIVAASILVLSKALGVLGSLSLKEIGIALLAIAGTFAVIGLAAVLLTPIIPLIAALGGALLILGAAMLLGGAGMALFAAGLATMATVGAAGIAVITAGAAGLAQLIPLFAQQVGYGLIAIAVVISESGPALVEAFVTVISSIFTALERLLPEAGSLISKLIETIINVVMDSQMAFYNAALDFILEFLTSAKDAIPAIVKAAGELVVAFIEEMAELIPTWTDRLFSALIKLMNDLAETIRRRSEEFGKAGGNLARAVIDGFLLAIKGFKDEFLQGLKFQIPSASEIISLFPKIPNPLSLIKGGGSSSSSSGSSSGSSGSSLGEPTPLGRSSGVQAGEDYNEGFQETAPLFERSMTDMASRMSMSMSRSMDMNPTVTPVLDLSELERESTRIGGLLSSSPLNTNMSYGQAAILAREAQAARDAENETQSEGERDVSITIQQHNTSPRALVPSDVYRETKSGVALAKEALKQV